MQAYSNVSIDFFKSEVFGGIQWHLFLNAFILS